jgi:hypothetical protein
LQALQAIAKAAPDAYLNRQVTPVVNCVGCTGPSLVLRAVGALMMKREFLAADTSWSDTAGSNAP